MSEDIKINKLSEDEESKVTGAVYAKSDKWWDADKELSATYCFDADNPWIVFDDKTCRVLGRYATKEEAKNSAIKLDVKAKEINRSTLKAGIDAYNQHIKYTKYNRWDYWENPIFK